MKWVECSLHGADKKCAQNFSYLPQAEAFQETLGIDGRKDSIQINLTETECDGLDMMLNQRESNC
jgi:hypothetical protein